MRQEGTPRYHINTDVPYVLWIVCLLRFIQVLVCLKDSASSENLYITTMSRWLIDRYRTGTAACYDPWHPRHGEWAPSTYWIGEWIGPRVCLSSHMASHYADCVTRALSEYTLRFLSYWLPVIKFIGENWFLCNVANMRSVQKFRKFCHKTYISCKALTAHITLKVSPPLPLLIHRPQDFLHFSKQSWNACFGIAFRFLCKFSFISSVVSNLHPFKVDFSLGNRKKSAGARSSE
jgi:hypothetical protein